MKTEQISHQRSFEQALADPSIPFTTRERPWTERLGYSSDLMDIVNARHTEIAEFIARVAHTYPFSVHTSDGLYYAAYGLIDAKRYFSSNYSYSDNEENHLFLDENGSTHIEFIYDPQGGIQSMMQTSVRNGEKEKGHAQRITIIPGERTVTTDTIFPIEQDPFGTDEKTFEVHAVYKQPRLRKQLKLQSIGLASGELAFTNVPVYCPLGPRPILLDNTLNRVTTTTYTWQRGEDWGRHLTKPKDDKTPLDYTVNPGKALLVLSGEEFAPVVTDIRIPPEDIYLSSILSHLDVPLLRSDALLPESHHIHQQYIKIRSNLEGIQESLKEFDEARARTSNSPHLRSLYVAKTGDSLLDYTKPLADPVEQMYNRLVQIRQAIEILMQNTAPTDIQATRLQQVIGYYESLVYRTGMGFGELARVLWQRDRRWLQTDISPWDQLEHLYQLQGLTALANVEQADKQLIIDTLTALDEDSGQNQAGEVLFGYVASLLDNKQVLTQEQIFAALQERTATELTQLSGLLEFIDFLRSEEYINDVTFQESIYKIFEGNTLLKPRQMRMYLAWTEYIFAEPGPLYPRRHRGAGTIIRTWITEMLAKLNQQDRVQSPDFKVEQDWIDTAVKVSVSDSYKSGLSFLQVPLHEYAVAVPGMRPFVRDRLLEISKKYLFTERFYGASLTLLELLRQEGNQEVTTNLATILADYETAFLYPTVTAQLFGDFLPLYMLYIKYLNELSAVESTHNVINERIEYIRRFMAAPYDHHPRGNEIRTWPNLPMQNRERNHERFREAVEPSLAQLEAKLIV